jgi:hypothetical protein
MATVVDETGNSYSFLTEGNGYVPDVRHSMANDALRAKLEREDADTLVLTKTFGTRAVFKKVGVLNRRVRTQGFSDTIGELYYRLDRVVDRNGNALEYRYMDAGTAAAVRVTTGAYGRAGPSGWIVPSGANSTRRSAGFSQNGPFRSPPK